MNQNQVELEREAEERLLDTSLGEVCGDAAAAAAAAAAASPPTRLFAAALILLGISVVFAVAALAPQPTSTPAQEPTQLPLPAPLRVEGADALRATDRHTKNLWCIITPQDMPLLAEFTDLRQLLLEEQLDPIGTWLANDPSWSLQPLAKCTHLQSLTIGNLARFSARQLSAVAQLPQLRELKLIGTVHRVDTAYVAEIQRLPLRSLALHAVSLEPRAFADLCRLPLLEQLELRDCLHLDRCDLTQLQKLRRLHTLTLRGVGGRFADSLSKSHPLADEPKIEPPPDGPGVTRTGLQMPGRETVILSPQLMQALAGLPDLSTLDLRSSVLDDATLAALPPQLQTLDLRGCNTTGPHGLAAAAPLPRLREFASGFIGRIQLAPPPGAINQKKDSGTQYTGKLQPFDDANASYCAFLQKHTLTRLTFEPQLEVRGDLLGAIAAQTQLQVLQLDLHDQPLLPEHDLTPLAKLSNLRRVELRGTSPAFADKLRRTLGDKVQVLVIDP